MLKYIFWNTNTLSKSMLASFGTCVLQNKRNVLSLLFHATELLNELMDAMGREQNLKKIHLFILGTNFGKHGHFLISEHFLENKKHEKSKTKSKSEKKRKEKKRRTRKKKQEKEKMKAKTE